MWKGLEKGFGWKGWRRSVRTNDFDAQTKYNESSEKSYGGERARD